MNKLSTILLQALLLFKVVIAQTMTEQCGEHQTAFGECLSTDNAQGNEKCFSVGTAMVENGKDDLDPSYPHTCVNINAEFCVAAFDCGDICRDEWEAWLECAYSYVGATGCSGDPTSTCQDYYDFWNSAPEFSAGYANHGFAFAAVAAAGVTLGASFL